MRTIVEGGKRLPDSHAQGGLRACGDGRFVGATRRAFEEITGLGPDDYYHFGNAGGVAAPTEGTLETEDDLVHLRRGVRILGWQGHLNECGGFPGEEDSSLARRILTGFVDRVDLYPDANHYGFVARLGNNGRREIDVYTPADARKFLRTTTIPLGDSQKRR